MRLRSVLWVCLLGLAGSAVLRSPALAFATLAGSTIAALVIVVRARLFRGVSFERTVSRRVVPWGGDLEVALSITNDKLLPLVWLRLRDQWPTTVEPLGYTLGQTFVLDRQELVQTVSVRRFERLRRRYLMRCTARGVHRFGPAEVQAGDPFGIAGVEAAWDEPREVVVLPRVLDVPGLALLRGRPLMEEQTESSLAVDPTALRGVRPYRPGDPVRALNWRATARTGLLHANEFDPSSLAAVRLLLDLGSLYRSWEAIEPELMELLCVVAASFAAAFADAGCAVGFATNATDAEGHRVVDLSPASGALPDVLEAIARLRPFTARDYGSVLRAELEDETASAECVVIAARLRPEVRATISQIREDRPTTVVFVGRPDDDEAESVDLVVPADTDWRGADALAIHA